MQEIADGARDTGARLVAFSSDYVFDGTKCNPYVEAYRPSVECSNLVAVAVIVPCVPSRRLLSSFRLPARAWGMALVAGAIVVIGAVMIQDPPGALTISMIGIGVVLLVAGAVQIGDQYDARTVVVIVVSATAGLIVLSAVRFLFVLASVPSVLVMQGLAVVVLVMALRRGSEHAVLARGVSVVALVVLTLVGIMVSYGEALDIDVYLLHEQAADAIRDGNNPYTTGNVAVWESHPHGDLELISEYTYPPMALVAYAGSSIALGDSRVIGAIAISLAFFLVFLYAGRRWGADRSSGHVDAAIVALMCANPMTFLIIYPAWTEAIALPFLVLTAIFWKERPFAAAVMLGLAFATKQYFLAAVPLLFFLPDPYRWRRVIVVGTTAALTFVPFVLWDAQGLFDGVVRHHLTRVPRPDAATLAGVGIHVPTAIGVGLAVVVGIVIARKALSGGQALLAVSSTIAVFTFLSVRGFRNSWWMVVILASVALVIDSGGVRSRTAPADATAAATGSRERFL